MKTLFVFVSSVTYSTLSFSLSLSPSLSRRRRLHPLLPRRLKTFRTIATKTIATAQQTKTVLPMMTIG